MKTYDNQIRSIRWDLLAELTGKEKRTVQKYFERHGMTISKAEDFITYLREYATL